MAIFGTVVPGETFGFRNRIINGDMRIDQRNAGASVSIPAGTSPTFSVDRTPVFNLSDAAAITAQQDSSAPSGFSNSLKVTVTTADATVAATDRAGIVHQIEGFNTSDFGFGTASAKTVTLSFWVRSSLTGTFGGNLNNNGNTRSYIFNYTISSADTWEYKTIVIPGDTSGTWVGATNGKGAGILFSLMAGTTFQGTLNTWNAANVHNTSGTVNLLGTLNATFYITGVQLEVGSVATPFERRPFGTELSLCQRYYQKYSGTGLVLYGYWDASNAAVLGFNYPVTPRVAPSGIGVSSVSHFFINNSAVGNPTATSIIIGSASTSTIDLSATVASGGSSTGKSCRMISSTSVAYIELTGCEL